MVTRRCEISMSNDEVDGLVTLIKDRLLPTLDENGDFEPAVVSKLNFDIRFVNELQNALNLKSQSACAEEHRRGGAITPRPLQVVASQAQFNSPSRSNQHRIKSANAFERHLERMTIGREQKHREIATLRISSRHAEYWDDPWCWTSQAARCRRTAWTRAGIGERAPSPHIAPGSTARSGNSPRRRNACASSPQRQSSPAPSLASEAMRCRGSGAGRLPLANTSGRLPPSESCGAEIQDPDVSFATDLDTARSFATMSEESKDPGFPYAAAWNDMDDCDYVALKSVRLVPNGVSTQ